MAIVKGPLFSLDAHGQVGKSLVFSDWKGIDTVRQYTIPANPRTAPQMAHRARLRGAVLDWQSVMWNPLDLAAWERLAMTQAQTMGGFNVFCRLQLRARVLGRTFALIHTLANTAITATGATITATGVAGLTYELRFGTKPTVLTRIAAVTVTAAALSAPITGLLSRVRYFYQIRCTTAMNDGRTGIGLFATI